MTAIVRAERGVLIRVDSSTATIVVAARTKSSAAFAPRGVDKASTFMTSQRISSADVSRTRSSAT